LIDNITVTDRQEESIKASLSNLNDHLKAKESNLFVLRTFTNGSYDRDTIIRPLKDIDLFAVLDLEKWKDENGNLPSPQSVLSKFKNYLDGLSDYKGKVRQDRPCVTIELSDKDFDVLPSFEQTTGGYLIPNYDLKSWTYSYPEQLTKNLDVVNRQRSYKVKPTIKAVKYWNRENGSLIPSYHIEEVTINIFQINSFKNYEESIRAWFDNAKLYLNSQKFNSNDKYDNAVAKIEKVKDKLVDARKHYDADEEQKAKEIWKKIFGDEFPSIEDEDVKEAKIFSKSLSAGALKITSAGTLSTSIGNSIAASKGFYGDIPKT
jgi:hypothetical protein